MNINELIKDYDELPEDGSFNESHPIFQMCEHIDALSEQRDELIAQNERLREAGNKLHDWFGCGNTPDAVELAYEWEEIERETPAQSLEAFKTAWNCPTIEKGTNRYGLDVAYFRNLFNRELNRTLQDYKPSELARNLLRMARTADDSVIAEDEFTGELRAQWQSEAQRTNDVSSGVVK